MLAPDQGRANVCLGAAEDVGIRRATACATTIETGLVGPFELVVRDDLKRSARGFALKRGVRVCLGQKLTWWQVVVHVCFAPERGHCRNPWPSSALCQLRTRAPQQIACVIADGVGLVWATDVSMTDRSASAI